MEGVVPDPTHPSPSNGPLVPSEPKKNNRRRPGREIVVNQGASSQARPPRRQRPHNTVGNSAEQATSGADPPEKVRKPKPQRKPPNADGDNGEGVLPPPKKEGGRRANFGANLTQPESSKSNPNSSNNPQGDHKSVDGDNGENLPAPPKSGRRAKFGATLTQPGSSSKSNPTVSNRPQGDRNPKRLPGGDDLASSLIRNLSTPPYPDCPICFSSIRPEQAIWSCSPSIPIVTSSEAQVQQYCWTSFHVKCIRSWAEKSVKEVADAWRARGETDKKGDWRCPGCQAKREAVPSGYWCFCNSTPEPKPLRLSTPHSCGNSCSRRRESGCGHVCPLQCHPGPCPPCQVTTRLECYCPKKKILTFRCGLDVRSKGVRNLSCGEVCARTLSCGKHACEKLCHDGDCGPCPLKELATCWCGKEQKEVNCGEGEEVHCFVEGETPWIGRFGCDSICKRSFDCGKHQCEKSCHPPSSKPAICPRSPSKIDHCPCGRNTIASTPTSDASQYTFPARLDCSDPIPTCDSVCSKPHLACSHQCAAKCHTGPCPPCTVQIVRPCRCGATTKSMACFQVHSASVSGVEEKEILCDKPCMALRACGRHECRRLCCPLASLAMTTNKKGKRRGIVDDNQGIGEEQGGLHECDLVCSKMLSCGNHRCEQRDHKGACPRCLRSSFEELVCFCGRTVYEPPIPCGTSIECHYPCPRPPPPCNHPSTLHSCHFDDVSCPPCPFLAAKQCACGKKIVPNTRCSLETEKVSCGTVCGKLMACGFHHCERLCHGDECGACTAPCGKLRKSCLPNYHPCTRPCHAPSSCPETEPCQSLVTLTCPCGRIRQSVPCGRTASSSRSALSPPKCNNDCEIAKRNARLADALGINTEGKNAGGVTYSDELVGFARVNNKFLPIVEKAFADFVTSGKRNQVLPHMPLDRRKFVHDLAAVYRMDTQMVDQEPHRSVQLLRRVDTRIPTPVLSAFIASTAPPPSLGKLADLRALRGNSAVASGSSSQSSWRANAGLTPSPKPPTPGSGTSTPVPSNHRGWTSVVANPAPAARPVVAAPRPMMSLAGTSGASAAQFQAGPPPGLSGSRAVTPAMGVTVPPPAVSNEPVPDSWEDDV